MPKLRVHNFSISLDGYGAGPEQSRDEPLGVGGEQLHDWVIRTPTFRAMQDMEGGQEGVDETFAARGVQGVGATIMGRNMFGPIRGEWKGDWRGWWGDNPPYHHPVFVLTHHAHEPIEMEGGTTFHFVTDGIRAAREQAIDAAEGQDVRIGGGSSTIRQYLEAGLVDELHVAVAPVLLGGGESLLHGVDLAGLGYRVTEFESSDLAAHFVVSRQDASK